MKKLRWNQLAVSTIGYQQYSLEHALDSIRFAGFENVELWGAEPHVCWSFYGKAEHRQRIREIVGMLHQRGLKLRAYAPEQLRVYPQNIASPNEYIRRWSEEMMYLYLEDCAVLGADVMSVLPGWEYIDQPSPDNYARAVEALTRLCRRAQELGVTLVMEPVSPCESTFVTNLGELKGLLRDVGSPALRPLLDLPNAAACAESVADWYRELGGVSHVHLADGDPDGYLALGSGCNDVAAQLTALGDAGYTGQITLSFNNAGYYHQPDMPVRTAAVWLRHCGLF